MSNLVKFYAVNAALFYAWGKVSFDAWDLLIDHGALLLAWPRWPDWLKSVMQLLYPAYFGYSSAKAIAAYPAADSFPARGRWRMYLGMVLLFAAGTAVGKRHGDRARLGIAP